MELGDFSTDQVQVLGRWRSNAYQLYLKNTAARAQAKREALAFCTKLIAPESAPLYVSLLMSAPMLPLLIILLSGLPVFEDMDTQRQQLLLAVSQANHPHQHRASQLYAATQAMQTSATQVHGHPAMAAAENQPGPSGASAPAPPVESHGPNVVPLNTVKCFICPQAWAYNSPDSHAAMKDERALHMALAHPDAHANLGPAAKRTTITITEDDNVHTLCPARWLPFPASAESLCRKLPKQIKPLTTDMDLYLVGLTIINKKPLEALFDRTNANLSLRQFSNARLLEHDSLRKRKLDVVTDSASAASIVLDENYEDIKSNAEAMQSIINYTILGK